MANPSLTLIRNAQIVNENRIFSGALLIEDDIIKSIYHGTDTPDLHDGISIIEADGKFLLPGIIDDQVHFRDPGLTHKADIESESRAAVAGGVTSFMEMPNTDPKTTTKALLRKKQQRASEVSVANYSFYLGATNDNIEEIRSIDPHTVCGVKLFMGASTGNMLVDDRATLEKIFSESPVLVACHCEDEKTVKDNLRAYIEEYGEDIPIEYHPLIRSREACLKSSSLAVELAQKFGSRVHIIHLSSEDELALFDNSLPLGEKKITNEVCVHHLWFNDNDYPKLGTLIKWNPAIKKESDRCALIDGLNDNRVDIIATDHAPHLLDEKQNIYTKAPSGGPLVQHSLMIMLELRRSGAITLEKIVEKMCHHPAILFGVEKRGFIREGYKADLCLVNPESPWQVTRDNILYKCGWSPFEGFTFSSKVEKTFVNGNLVWDNGKINDKFRGELLTFNR